MNSRQYAGALNSTLGMSTIFYMRGLGWEEARYCPRYDRFFKIHGDLYWFCDIVFLDLRGCVDIDAEKT